MSKNHQDPLDGVIRAADAESEVGDEVKQEFEEAAQRGSAGPQQLIEKLRQHHSTSPVLSGGDVDAAWEDDAVGEESVGGENPTPDQDVVDELGQAVGLLYSEGEPLHSTEKIEARDEHRWELDPASAEDYPHRPEHEGGERKR